MMCWCGNVAEIIFASPVVANSSKCTHWGGCKATNKPARRLWSSSVSSNAFNLPAVHSDRSTRHPFRCRRNHEGKQVRDLFWTSVAADLGFFRKLLCRFLHAHVMRWRPPLKERAPSLRHYCTRHDTVHLHAVLNALFSKCFTQRRDSCICRRDCGKGRLRVEGGAA